MRIGFFLFCSLVVLRGVDFPLVLFLYFPFLLWLVLSCSDSPSVECGCKSL